MKKKGFTLIELLAVIVILVIIALIIVPAILNIIEKSKIKALEQSIENYVATVEKIIVAKKIDNQDTNYSGIYTVKKDVITKKEQTAYIGKINTLALRLEVKMKGILPESGELEIDDKGQVIWGNFMINKTNLLYENGEVNKDSSNSTLVARINDLEAKLVKENDKGKTIILSASLLKNLTCNSIGQGLENYLTLSKVSNDSSHLFEFSNGMVEIKKSGYYYVSSYQQVQVDGWLQVSLQVNGDTISADTIMNGSGPPEINVATIAYVPANSKIRIGYWCDQVQKFQRAKLTVTYVHE